MHRVASSLPRLSLLCAALSLTGGIARAQGSPTLWVSDDTTKTIYHLETDGTVITSWASGSVSGLSVDPVDDTLWAAKEGFNRIVQFDRDGNELGYFEGTVLDPDIQAPEGVAVDYGDGTLWVVDDETLEVYNAQKDGTYIASFPTTAYDGSSTSPQSIAADPNGTLWLTDNASKSIYNVTHTGALLASFGTDVYGVDANNPQGISVDERDGTLWVTDRVTHLAYHILRDGTLLSSFDTAVFGSLNPTGIAFDGVVAPPPVIDLGLAAGFALLGLDSVQMANWGTLVHGDVGIGPHGFQYLVGGKLDGDLIKDPTSSNYGSGTVITGAILYQDLSGAFEDALEALDAAEALPADASYGYIYKDGSKIQQAGDVTVVDVAAIDMWYGRTLTLVGTADATFVVRTPFLRTAFGGRVVLSGGLRPENVFFVVDGCGSDVVAAFGGVLQGTLLVPQRNVLVAYDARLDGAAITGRHAAVWGGSRVEGPAE